MKKNIIYLIKLQEVSKEIFDLKKIIESEPPEINVQRIELQNKKDMLEELNTELEKRKHSIDTKNRQIETYEDNFKHSREKEKYITSQKEFEKLDEEQQYLQEKIDENKKEIESLKKEIEEIQFNYEEIKEEIEGRSEYLEEMEGNLKEKRKEVEKKLKEKKAERGKIVPHIDSAVLSLYERIVDNKQGVGIVPVEDSICQGCFISIPASLQNQLKRLDRIITCNNCSRILYLPNVIAQHEEVT